MLSVRTLKALQPHPQSNCQSLQQFIYCHMGYDYFVLMVEWELELLSSLSVFEDICESHCPVGLSPAVLKDYYQSSPWSTSTSLEARSPLGGTLILKPFCQWVTQQVLGFAQPI